MITCVGVQYDGFDDVTPTKTFLVRGQNEVEVFINMLGREALLRKGSWVVFLDKKIDSRYKTWKTNKRIKIKSA